MKLVITDVKVFSGLGEAQIHLKVDKQGAQLLETAKAAAGEAFFLAIARAFNTGGQDGELSLVGGTSDRHSDR